MVNSIKKIIASKYLLRGFRGDGGIYVIFILATVMLGAFALTGGLTPHLNPTPSASDQVEIDEESARRSSEQSLQLVDIRVKPTATPTPETPQECYDSTAVAMLVDVSGSMADRAAAGSSETKMDVLKRALNNFRNNFTPDTMVGLFAFSTNTDVLVPFGVYGQNETLMAQQIAALRPGQLGQSTNTRQGLELAYNNLAVATQHNPQRRFSLVFFTDGVPENNDCEFVDSQEVYRANNGTGPICAQRFSDHPEYPGPISSQIKSLNVRIYTVALYRQPPYSSGTQNSIETIMRNVSSNPDEQYYIGLPSTVTLEQAYNTIAQRICQ